MKALRGTGGLSLTSALDGGGLPTARAGRFTAGRDNVRGAAGSVWEGAKNFQYKKN